MSVNIRNRRRAAAGGSAKPPERERTKFTADLLNKLVEDLTSGRLGTLDKLSVSDDVQDGLRAIVRKTGLITFHAHYNLGEERPYIKVGHFPGTKIDDARTLTATIRALADKGIDVSAGLHDRLLDELARDGSAWRPRVKDAVDEVLESLKNNGVSVTAAVVKKVRADLGAA